MKVTDDSDKDPNFELPGNKRKLSKIKVISSSSTSSSSSKVTATILILILMMKMYIFLKTLPLLEFMNKSLSQKSKKERSELENH